jgi:pimeloyl-ACP methyl ester carboxylesterase
MNIYIRFVLITLCALSFNSHASDLAKEQRWSDQVVDAIIDGEAVWLNDGKNNFLSIYTEADENKGRAVIVMHGTGVHPNWQQVVQPLRVGLTRHHWSTLSIQMPVLANDADYQDYAPLYDEVAPRIDAAIQFLKDNGMKEIVLLGHSQGATMSAYYLSTSKQDIKGFVAIGMGSFADDPRMNSVNSLEKIHIPVLDLYGSEDLKEVLASTGQRAAAAKKAGNKNYTQKEIAGNHFYDGHEDELLKTVADWLDNTPGL